jgi:hypothetical protein
MRICCRDCGGPDGDFQQETGVPLQDWAEDYAWGVWDRASAAARRIWEAEMTAAHIFPKAVNLVGPGPQTADQEKV